MPLAVATDVDTPSPQLWFVHADHLDRPVKMTDGNKATVWDAVYQPFGEAFAILGAATNNQRFPGQYFLIEAGLHYNWHRHYDPTIGRYLQTDPLGFVDGPSMYAYVKSAPTMRVDPEGLQIVIPRPGMTPVPPGIFDGWKRYAERGLQGLWNFCRRTASGLGGSRRDPNDQIARKSGTKRVRYVRLSLQKPLQVAE
jgi:RHS repeat-associated protein